MTREQVAEMFSIVKKINDNEWLNKSAPKATYVPVKPYVQTIADKLKLQLSQKDFKMVTKKPEALRSKLIVIVVTQVIDRGIFVALELNKVLLEHRDIMRSQNIYKFIPVTIDELMFRFCLNEKRKECESIWQESTKALIEQNTNNMTDDEIYEFVDETISSMSRMIGEDNSEFSRFRNEQNRIYLQLLEKAGASPE